MARRSTWRIPIRLEVRFSSGEKSYDGTIRNLSEDGMFISFNLPGAPPYSTIEISLPCEDGTLRLPARPVRYVMDEGWYSGMGVRLIDPPDSYRKYIENLLYTM